MTSTWAFAQDLFCIITSNIIWDSIWVLLVVLRVDDIWSSGDLHIISLFILGARFFYLVVSNFEWTPHLGDQVV